MAALQAIIHRQNPALFRMDEHAASDIMSVDAMPGAIPIAGVPLLLRQLQWLRSLGIQDITIELGEHPKDDQLADMLRYDVFGRHARLIRSNERRSPQELVKASAMQYPVLAIPSDTIGDGDLSTLFAQPSGAGRVFTLPSPFVGDDTLVSANITIIDRENGPSPIRPGPGWGARIRHFEDARILGRAALLGMLPARDDVHRCPINVHAKQTQPGVWIARGARVHVRTALEPPVLVGRGAIVCRQARIGPDAFLGDHTVIAAGAQLRSCFITPGTLVGENAQVESVVAYPDRVHALDDADCEQTIHDRRLLSRRDLFLPAHALVRVFTVLLLLALTTAILLFLARYIG